MRFQDIFWGLFLSLGLVAGCTVVYCQNMPAPDDEIGLTDPEGILHELAPDTIPLDSLNPKPANRARAIRMLLNVKRQNSGWNKQEATYLLALLGHEYVLNRDELLKIWHGCVVKEDSSDCDERTAMVLIGLYEHGHQELLHPLFAGNQNSDGALSEELYPFYAEQLERKPKKFVLALSGFSLEAQQALCENTGGEIADEAGGGPTDGSYPRAMIKVLHSLKGMDGAAAARCISAAKKGYGSMVAAIREEEKGPARKQ